MKKISEETFICLDCEMTGLDPINDRVIEVAVVLFNNSEILESYETLIDPEIAISEASQAIHNISQEMVTGQPTIDKVLPKILEMVGRKIIVGHGIRLDVEILQESAKRSGIAHKLNENRLIDTLRLARLYGESPVNSLDQLRRHFNIEPCGAHRAMSDVVVNIEVFKHLVRRFKSVDDVFDVLSRPILMKAMPLGKHKGRLMKEIPLNYLEWASHQDFDQDLIFSLRTEIKRRRKGGSFLESGNPFAGL